MVVAVESMRAVLTHKFAMFLTVPGEDDPQRPAEPKEENLFIRELIRRILRNRLEHVSLQAGFHGAHEALQDIRQPHFDTGLPFEFVVLETMLATATRILHVELRDLEGVALSNIEAMASKVSRETLEGVREVKLRLTVLTRRALRLERVCGCVGVWGGMWAGAYTPRGCVCCCVYVCCTPCTYVYSVFITAQPRIPHTCIPM